MTFFQTNFGQIWEVFGVLKPFLWHFGQLLPTKRCRGGGAFIRENTLYISLLHYTGNIATSRWIQFQLPISVVFWQASPVSVWACEGAELHVPHTQKNMSCQSCSLFELNSDYIWERHVLKLLADGQVLFLQNLFLHYLPDGIGSKWVKWYWGTYMKNSFYNLRMLPI